MQLCTGRCKESGKKFWHSTQNRIAEEDSPQVSASVEIRTKNLLFTSYNEQFQLLIHFRKNFILKKHNLEFKAINFYIKINHILKKFKHLFINKLNLK